MVSPKKWGSSGETHKRSAAHGKAAGQIARGWVDSELGLVGSHGCGRETGKVVAVRQPADALTCPNRKSAIGNRQTPRGLLR